MLELRLQPAFLHGRAGQGRAGQFNSNRPSSETIVHHSVATDWERNRKGTRNPSITVPSLEYAKELVRESSTATCYNALSLRISEREGTIQEGDAETADKKKKDSERSYLLTHTHKYTYKYFSPTAATEIPDNLLTQTTAFRQQVTNTGLQRQRGKFYANTQKKEMQREVPRIKIEITIWTQ